MADRDRIPDPVHALAAAQASQEIVWFAARATGLYRSTDGGGTWSDALSSLELDAQLTVASVAPSPSFSDDGMVFAGALGGILRTADGGTSWSVAELPAPPPFVVSLVVSPNYAQDGLVFAGTLEDGVFRSWDRGATWASWNFGLLDLNVFCLVASPSFAVDDTLYVGTESGVFRSTNGGRAWRETAFPMDASPVLSLAISSSDAGDHVLYAGTESNGVLRSEDGDIWVGAGLQDTSEAVNQLLPMDRGSASTMATTGTAAYVLGGDDGSSAELWTAPAGAEISAATMVEMDSQPAALFGMSDGSVHCVPIPNEPAWNESEADD